MLRQHVVLLVAAVAVCGTTLAAEPVERPVTVFAAASLTNALDKIGRRFTESTGVSVRFSFAASSILARQIEAGAPADAFFSADLEWMDYLEQRGAIDKSSRRNVLGNELVLIARVDSKIELKIEPGFDLAAALGEGRLATGDPDSVPVGRYARAALTSLGAWSEVADRLVRAEDVRHALAFVARGESPLGIVYVTDARADERVRIVGTFPADSHPPISYPMALTPQAGPAAAQFAEFVRGATARAVFEEFGFKVLR